MNEGLNLNPTQVRLENMLDLGFTKNGKIWQYLNSYSNSVTSLVKG